MYCLVTILVTAVTLFMEYDKTEESILFQLQRLEEGFEQPLLNSIWELDQNQIRALLYGIQKNPIIAGVAIQDNDGHIIGRIGTLPSSETRRPLLPIFSLLPYHAFLTQSANHDLASHPFDLTLEKGTKNRIARVTLYWDRQIVMDEVSQEFRVLIIAALIKTAALWLIFFHYQKALLTRPLAAFNRHIGQLSQNTFRPTPFSLQSRGRNEFTLLADHFNRMVRTFSEAYDAIQEKNHQLRQACQAREQIDTLQREKGSAEASDREKNRFLATVSHAVRTPMNGIAATVALLRRTPLNPEQQDYLEIIHTANTTLATQLDTLFGLTTIEAGKDSAFCVAQPLQVDRRSEPDAPASPPPPTTHQAATKRSILLVEDEPVSQMMVTKLLELEGFYIEVAENGEEALKKVAKKPFDLILMDLRMPGMDGFETTRRIQARENPRQPPTPIAAFTADMTLETVEKCHQAGMFTVVPKPIQPAAIRQLFKKNIPENIP